MSVVILIGVMVWLWVRRPSEVMAPRRLGVVSETMDSGIASAVATPPAPSLVHSPHLRRITDDQRRQIQALIAEAHTRRANAGSATVEPADDRSDGARQRITVERVSMPVKAALEEATPVLAECYVRTGKKQPRAAVLMTLVGDPSVGTLVDPSQMFDPEHKPLDPALDHCLRDTFSTLELPPLDEGDKLDIQYSFRFDD